MKVAVCLAAVAATLCLVAGTASAIPSHCASPKQWTGRVFRYDASRQSHTRVNVAGAYFYDESNLRKARIEQAFINNDKPVDVHIIEDFKAKTYYEIELHTGACKTGNLTFPFIPHAVPDNANFTGDFIIGSSAVPGGSVEVQTWNAEFDDPSSGDKIFWFGEFTSTGCVPVVTQFATSDNFFTESFVDIVVGIADPNVFIPPSSCNN